MRILKIGVVTLFDYNYGSSLQSFATKCIIESLGFECEILKEQTSAKEITSYSKRIFSLLLLIGKRPVNAKKIMKIVLSSSAKNLQLTKESEQKIHTFTELYLNVKMNTFERLKTLAQDDDYICFFSGSDQVWNGAAVDNYQLRFLRFSPQEKRVAWAPSFGGSVIEKYNQSRYGKYIEEYRWLSVRENSGAELIESLIGKKAEILCDPVILLGAKQWREKYRHFVECLETEDYILLFFIDRPSDKAISFLKKIVKNENIRIISFGYQYEQLSLLENMTHCDGDPFKFLYYIDHAKYVLTDSFHATVFSVIFHTRFFAFDREYQHSQNQSIRLKDFLKKTTLLDRYEPHQFKEEISFNLAEKYMMNEKSSALSYLDRVLSSLGVSPMKRRVPYITKALCCGCGACIAVCLHDAIRMIKLENDGHFYPEIDISKCTNCNLCHKICQFSKKSDIIKNEEKAYVAAGKDQDLISNSASGGIFAVLANRMLEEGGIVYGATLKIEAEGLSVVHERIDSKSDLKLVQGSKYVQSDMMHVFKEVQDQLENGQWVLFSGTSCQVAALNNFLKRRYENLLTLDLICHGVPSVQLLSNYVKYIEKKYCEKVIDLSFRCKDQDSPYVFIFTFSSGRKKRISLRDSAFYRMFMSCLGYRDSCYHCKYASINKPADITLGDFYLSESECEKLNINMKDFKSKYLSSVITHSEIGESAFKEVQNNCDFKSIQIQTMIEKHEQLKHSSKPQNGKMWKLYLNKGFSGVQKEINRKNIMKWIPGRILKITGIL